MTNFQKPTFSVPVGSRDPKGCEHGEKPWLDPRGCCVLCGEKLADPRDRTLDADSGDVTINGHRARWDSWYGKP